MQTKPNHHPFWRVPENVITLVRLTAEGHTYRQIAEAMGISSRAVHSKLASMHLTARKDPKPIRDGEGGRPKPPREEALRGVRFENVTPDEARRISQGVPAAKMPKRAAAWLPTTATTAWAVR